MRLDHNRMVAQPPQSAPRTPTSRTLSWGNHSADQYPDVSFRTLPGARGRAGGRRVAGQLLPSRRRRRRHHWRRVVPRRTRGECRDRPHTGSTVPPCRVTAGNRAARHYGVPGRTGLLGSLLTSDGGERQVVDGLRSPTRPEPTTTSLCALSGKKVRRRQGASVSSEATAPQVSGRAPG